MRWVAAKEPVVTFVFPACPRQSYLLLLAWSHPSSNLVSRHSPGNDHHAFGWAFVVLIEKKKQKQCKMTNLPIWVVLKSPSSLSTTSSDRYTRLDLLDQLTGYKALSSKEGDSRETSVYHGFKPGPRNADEEAF